MKIRVTALILTILMLLFAVVGCSEKNDDNNVETTAKQEAVLPDETTEPVETEYVPTFVDADYGNDEFVVFQRNSNASSYAGLYITSAEVTDTMSEATFNRNLAVEEKYKVKIVAMEEGDPYKSIKTYVQSGDVPFDVILDRRFYMGTSAQEGYLHNFNDLDHVDYTQKYWDANCLEGYDVAGKVFFMANDISVANLSGARFFFFNKEIVKDNNLDDPYVLIEKNQWTLEKFLTMVEAVSSDANGDGLYDGNDIYGLCSETGASNGNIMHMLVGCGVKFTEKNPDGTLDTNAYNDRTQTIMTKIGEAIIGKNYVATYDSVAKGADKSGYANNYDYGRSLFASDHFLFIQGNMGVTSQFKDMQSDYGVAPNPKYDEAQDSYHHKLDKYSLIWAIPECNMDYDRTGVILEYWAYESSKTVMPAYYEITIKTKRVNEETASNMIDLVKATILYDISEIYDTGINDILYSGYTSGNLGSTWAKSKKIINNKLTSIYNKIAG